MSEHEPEQEKEVHDDNTDLALPGQRLKRTREELRLSRDEVAHHLHLDVQIVDALEADDFEKLPSPAYICGYLRSYARILKLPEDDVVNSYRKGEEINATLVPNNIRISPDRQINFAVVKYIAILILILAIGAGLVWAVDQYKLLDKSMVTGTQVIPLATPDEDTPVERPAQIQQQIQLLNSQSEPVSSSDTGVPKIDTSSTDSPRLEQQRLTIAENEISNDTTINVPASSGDLKLVYNKDSWTEIVDAKGTRHIYRLVKKNSELFFDGTPPYTILLGAADGVEVIYNDKTFNHKRYQRDQIAYFRLGLADD